MVWLDHGFDAATIDDLMAHMRHVQTRRSHAEALQAVVDGVVATLGFDVAVLNVVRDDHLVCGAVAANPDNPDAVITPADLVPLSRQEMDAELALGTALGDLVFVHHSRASSQGASWVPQIPVPEDPDDWHPMDALYALLRDDDGELQAVLSVDLPSWGMVPDERHATMLSLYAAHSSLALTHAKLVDRSREQERELRLAFDRATNGMALLHLTDTGEVLGGRVNPALCTLLGRTPDEFAGVRLADLVAPGHGDELTAFLLAGEGGDGTELRALHSDGTQRWVRCSSGVVERSAERTTVVVHVQDIGEQRRRGDELVRQATRDDLTGLWSRRVLDERLAFLASQALDTGEPAAVLFVDVDGFKQVNDTYGHAAGDQTLVAVGRRLVETVRPCDTVVRVGGDEFVVLMPGVFPHDLGTVIERLRDAVARPVALDTGPIHVSVSIGAALTGEGPVVADELLAEADRDMYARKRSVVR